MDLMEDGWRDIGNAVERFVWDGVRFPIVNSVWDAVEDSVRCSVGNSTRGSIEHSVWHSVWNGTHIKDNYINGLRLWI